ncbi:phosphotransferase [Nocardioides sp. MAH-18]|uniref:Phosphotransferase n=1 Tax=Nocardioides agri TaxID=2682843 RepID=A0A6L6XYD6_9ACTN|nr:MULTISPECIES: aminoglycoside phosphotransferase family protein [unclassified Nocardioides]MBA2952570.1 aminoglycoside phosphotransferase family protein [Nocardioides sp. CGMCC 1.13656]MVQ51733.1 phosphotransferase [Nocardioides sp. MAH-18]
MQMHDDQVAVTQELVRGLLDRQLPQYTGLPLRPVAEHGTDHSLFRLGEDLVVRMPVYAGSADQAASDARWLPVLAPHLPVAVPVPVALGEPDETYPFPWSVVPWLPGTPPAPGNADPHALAADLAGFVRDLHAVDTSGGPAKTGTSRGTPIRGWDPHVRAAIDEAGDRVDRPRVLAAWEDCLAAPDWPGDPVWIHGDLLAGNLLVHEGRLSAVIDFGALGLGDPAPDLQPAWATLPSEARAAYLDALGYDDDTVRRGRGWALGPALTGIPYYWDTVPAFAQRGLRTVAAVLADLER